MSAEPVYPAGLPKTTEEWLDLLAAYRTTEGCGCCRHQDPSVDALRNAVATVAPSARLGPAHAAPLPTKAGERLAVSAWMAEADAARVRWAVALGGRVPSCSPCRFGDFDDPCESPDLCPPRAEPEAEAKCPTCGAGLVMPPDGGMPGERECPKGCPSGPDNSVAEE